MVQLYKLGTYLADHKIYFASCPPQENKLLDKCLKFLIWTLFRVFFFLMLVHKRKVFFDTI